MNSRQTRLAETWDGIAGPLSRLQRSLRDDVDAISQPERAKNDHALLATDAFLQRFQQVADLTLRKLFPRMVAVLEQSDTRLPFGTVLDRLDGYEVIDDVPGWLALNDLRNRLVHEYAMTDEDRTRELSNALSAAERLADALTRLRDDRVLSGKLFA